MNQFVAFLSSSPMYRRNDTTKSVNQFTPVTILIERPVILLDALPDVGLFNPSEDSPVAVERISEQHEFLMTIEQLDIAIEGLTAIREIALVDAKAMNHSSN